MKAVILMQMSGNETSATYELCEFLNGINSLIHMK